MNEAETRAEHIDPALKAAGWRVVEGSKVLREHPITPGRLEALGGRGSSTTTPSRPWRTLDRPKRSAGVRCFQQYLYVQQG
jgi:hypothetical protein